MISALIHHAGPRSRAAAAVLLMLALGSSGCGSSPNELSSGIQGTAKEKKPEERYRYEGTGKAKQKTLIRREDERHKELREAAKKSG